MRGGSAPSCRQGQGLSPAEKAETAARCGFEVPVLEGARRGVIRKCTFRRPSSSRAPGRSLRTGEHSLRWLRPGHSQVDPERIDLARPSMK